MLPQWLVPRGQRALRVSFAMVEAVGDAEDVEGKENIYFERDAFNKTGMRIDLYPSRYKLVRVYTILF